MIRSKETKQKRLQAITKVVKETGVLYLDHVNQHLSKNHKFANVRELAQAARQVKPEFGMEVKWTPQNF